VEEEEDPLPFKSNQERGHTGNATGPRLIGKGPSGNPPLCVDGYGVGVGGGRGTTFSCRICSFSTIVEDSIT
jgi:hypothetical protein